MLFHMIYNMTHKNLNMTAKKIIKYKFMKKSQFSPFNCFCFALLIVILGLF